MNITKDVKKYFLMPKDLGLLIVFIQDNEEAFAYRCTEVCLQIIQIKILL